MLVTDNTVMGLYLKKWIGDGNWPIALAMD
jgi:hypothetical protein